MKIGWFILFVLITSLFGNQSLIMAYDQERLLAGHLLRRIGFGPNDMEMKAVLSMGRQRYIEFQLNPKKIRDVDFSDQLVAPPNDEFQAYDWIRRWYTTMVYSRKQLQEKMTLIWHEHFATSNEKVGRGRLMHDQEEFLRAHCLDNFRELAIGISKDQAMLIFLDNNFNSGIAVDTEGNRIPPNENYAREFLQLFTMGPVRLKQDGTPVLTSRGKTIPNYTERDVREIARALTGWQLGKNGEAIFNEIIHDDDKKIVLGKRIPARDGIDGARDLQDVVDIVLNQPSVAPFISKILIQKIATETPTPEYVERVATVFSRTGGNIKATVRAILTDKEFESEAVVRTQFKEPIEFLVGALRALNAETSGYKIGSWTENTRQLVYYPPSVFSFYPPGNKGALTDTALLSERDQAAEEIVSSYFETVVNAEDCFRPSESAAKVVDRLADRLLAAPLHPRTRERIISYFGGTVNVEKVRGAIWLILVSPDYQLN